MAVSAQLDAVFAALSDATRRAILARLAAGEASVTELAEPFEVSQPAISKHLKVLERARLIIRDREAQRRLSRLAAGPMAEAARWLADYESLWESPSTRADQPMAGEKPAKKKKGKKHKHKKH